MLLFLPSSLSSSLLCLTLTTSSSTYLTIFLASCFFFTSVPVSGEGDLLKIVWKPIKHSDYTLGPAYTKEFDLVGKDNAVEKVRVMEKPGLFSKDFKVVCKSKV